MNNPSPDRSAKIDPTWRAGSGYSAQCKHIGVGRYDASATDPCPDRNADRRPLALSILPMLTPNRKFTPFSLQTSASARVNFRASPDSSFGVWMAPTNWSLAPDRAGSNATILVDFRTSGLDPVSTIILEMFAALSTKYARSREVDGRSPKCR